MSKENFFHSNAFDLEGTGVNLEPLHQESFSLVASRRGIVFGPQEFHGFVGAGDEAIAKAIAGMVDADHILIREEKNGIYRAMLRSYIIEPRTGFPEYLDEVKRLGGELVLASITPDADAMEILQRSHLLQYFDIDKILTESSVTRRKPDPEVYQKAAELLGIKSGRSAQNEMLVHEDSPTGVTAGKNAGGRVAAFPVHDGLIFNPKPDVLFLSWEGVSPQVVFDKVMSADA